MPRFLHIGTMPAPRATFPLHAHGYWEICCYTFGQGEVRIGSETVPFGVGRVICMPPNVPHSETSPGGFNTIFMGVQGFAAGSEAILLDDDGSFRSVAEALLREYQKQGQDWRVAVESLFRVLLLYLRRGEKRSDPLVARIERELLARFREPSLSLSGLASRLGVSEDRLYRRFRAATGQSPRAYLTRLRIEEAKHLLRHGERVHTVAAQVGLPDPYYFSRLFSAHVGQNPRDYRQRPED